MPDMYEKLGDLLNNALESGTIPQEDKVSDDSEAVKQNEKIKDRDTSSENCDKSGPFSFNHNEDIKKEKVKIPKRKLYTIGQVIKMHKYTENMQFQNYPPEIMNALTTLDIAYPITRQKIKNQYRKMLKLYHPDTNTTIHKSQTVLNNRHLTIDDIKLAYNILDNYFTL